LFIQTIGDAYFCVGGLPGQPSDHPERVLRFAIDTLGVIRQFNETSHSITDEMINIRIGINSGPVVAGVIGTKKCKLFEILQNV